MQLFKTFFIFWLASYFNVSFVQFLCFIIVHHPDILRNGGIEIGLYINKTKSYTQMLLPFVEGTLLDFSPFN